MKTHLLIDLDPLVYRMAHSEQTVVKWHEDVHSTFAKLDPAIVKVRQMVAWLQDFTDADKTSCALSAPGRSFRVRVYPQYKGQRKGADRPVLFHPLREWAYDELGAISRTDLEGDDILSILHTADPDEPTVIATIDKDLWTVPGAIVNWDRPEKRVQVVTPERADYAFYGQCLTGDRVDNLPGCPGIGPVKAQKLLDAHWDAHGSWEAVWRDVIVPTYEKAKLNETVALQQARCLRMLRDHEYDRKTGEITLWSPAGEEKE